VLKRMPAIQEIEPQRHRGTEKSTL
jgi:hypothetical protein